MYHTVSTRGHTCTTLYHTVPHCINTRPHEQYTYNSLKQCSNRMHSNAEHQADREDYIINIKRGTYIQAAAHSHHVHQFSPATTYHLAQPRLHHPRRDKMPHLQGLGGHSNRHRHNFRPGQGNPIKMS